MKALLVLLGCIVLGTVTWATTFTVGPDPKQYDFTSLEVALQAAAAGDEIVLTEGLYWVDATITKPLTLRGEGDVILRPTGYVTFTVRVREGTLRLVGLSFRGGSTAVRMERSTGELAIEDCTFEEYGTALNLIEGRANVNKSLFYGCDEAVSVSASRLTVEGTMFELNGTAVAALRGARVKITDCSFLDNDLAISGETPCSVTGTGNSFVGNLLDLSGGVDPALRPPTRNAHAEVIHFPSVEYKSLQEAVDALLPGGVLILDGDFVWVDSAVVDKPLHILAEGSSSIRVWGREAKDGKRLPVFSFLGPCEVTIERLYLGGGITVGPEVHLTLREVRLPDRPLELSGEAQLLWEGGYGSLSVSSEASAEVSQVSLSGGPAVAADDLARVRLVSCKVEGWSSSWGSAATILVASRAEFEIEDCVIRGGSVAYTVECGGWSTTKITGSQLRGARQAVLHLSGPSDVSLKEVTIADSRGAGVLLSGDAHLHLDGVTLEKNALGMTVLNAGCGFEQAGGLFMVQVHPEVEIGPDGIVFKDNGTDLCPDYPGDPWPEGFLRAP